MYFALAEVVVTKIFQPFVELKRTKTGWLGIRIIYGMELLVPSSKPLEQLELFQKRILKQILYRIVQIVARLFQIVFS
jgi:hypothetical protein